MNQLIDKQLIDEATDAYVDWREERGTVWDAYARWTNASVADSPLAFSAYQAALDREECAAHAYAELMTRVSVAVPTFPLDVTGESCVRA
jgi:hypothetical protein